MSGAAVGNARLEGLVTDLHISRRQIESSRVKHMESVLMQVLSSSKSVLNRFDLVLYRLCYLRSDSSPSHLPILRADQIQVPCNVVLKLTTPQLWLPTLTLAWGVVATLMGISQNREGFYAARFFLGVTESGLFPGVVFYLSMWYKRNEQHYRVALFFSAASLAGAFGGILAYVSIPPPTR